MHLPSLPLPVQTTDFKTSVDRRTSTVTIISASGYLVFICQNGRKHFDDVFKTLQLCSVFFTTWKWIWSIHVVAFFYSLWFWYEEADKHPSAVVLCSCYSSTSHKLFLFIILIMFQWQFSNVQPKHSSYSTQITLFGNVKGKTEIKLTPCNYPSSSLFIMQLYHF